MSKNATYSIDARTLFILEKVREEHEVAKRQGFPSRLPDASSQYGRSYDSKVSDKRWYSWLNELGIDQTQGEAILDILVSEGLIEKYQFVPNYF